MHARTREVGSRSALIGRPRWGDLQQLRYATHLVLLLVLLLWLAACGSSPGAPTEQLGRGGQSIQGTTTANVLPPSMVTIVDLSASDGRGHHHIWAVGNVATKVFFHP